MLVSRYSVAVDESDLNRLADSLGVTAASLDLLDIGWMGNGTWSFPMYNAERTPVGIRTRCEDGSKRAVKGTKEGLFIPYRRREGLLVITEGPTDCAAILDLEFDCIGRPSCYGGEEYAAAMSAGRKVAILADNDASSVGTIGAERLAKAIKRSAREVRIVHCPYTKDAREWVRNGGTRESLEIMYAYASSV